MNAHSKLFQLELNEINFDFVRRYNALGELPHFARLIEKHGIVHTTSESRYEELEPWIQWVTAHTGLTLAQHGVFRLGDIMDHELCQIWEWLEARGISVAAVSPMNASNRTSDAAFFLPDPWTATKPTGSNLLKQVAVATSNAVNDNAGTKLDIQSATVLVRAFLRYFGLAEYTNLMKYLLKAARGQKWALALVLDELLTAITIAETRAKAPQFVSLFLNGGAHLQHHFMFNSAVYGGPHRNPTWLINANDDPILAVYRQYDRHIGRILKSFPDYRLLIATGLHQNPYPNECYYWRLADHAAFLTEIGCENFEVHPRMSRDFLIETACPSDARAIQVLLEAAIADDGSNLFEVDNRGSSLFVMMTYSNDIAAELGFTIHNRHFHNLRSRVNFVAIKNGEHNGIGYLIDTRRSTADRNPMSQMPLADLPILVAENFGLIWPARSATPVLENLTP